MSKYVKSNGVGDLMADPFLHDYTESDGYKTYRRISAKYYPKFHVKKNVELNMIAPAKSPFVFNGRRRRGLRKSS